MLFWCEAPEMFCSSAYVETNPIFIFGWLYSLDHVAQICTLGPIEYQNLTCSDKKVVPSTVSWFCIRLPLSFTLCSKNLFIQMDRTWTTSVFTVSISKNTDGSMQHKKRLLCTMQHDFNSRLMVYILKCQQTFPEKKALNHFFFPKWRISRCWNETLISFRKYSLNL